MAGQGVAGQGTARQGYIHEAKNMDKNTEENGYGNKKDKKESGIEWAYTHNLRQVFGKQQGAVKCDGQGIYQRTGAFGIAVNKHLIVSLCAEYRECHAKGSWARL